MNASLKIFYGIIGLGLIAYLYVLSQFYFKTDIAILSNFAERMLSGEKMADAYYEVNPPLSMIVYIPQIWLKNLLGIPVYYAHTAYICLLIMLSSVLAWGLLQRLPILESRERLCIFGLLVTDYIMVPNFSFGDREHLIVLGLVPFVLVQCTLHFKTEIPRVLLVASLALGAVAVLIKPHYGLLPVALMLWRFWRHRDFRFYQAPDFWALSASVILYGLILYYVFPDFLNVILPDVIALYLPLTSPAVYQELFVFSFVTACVGATALTFNIQKHHKAVIVWLMAVTFLLFIPYLVQGKGFDYHRIPWMYAFSLFLGVIVYALSSLKTRKDLSLMMSTVVVIAVVWAIRPLPFERPTHQEFKELPLSVLLEEECPHPCTFLLLYDSSELIHQLAIYHDAVHGSRFTSMWYLLPLIRHEQSLREGRSGVMPDAQYKALKAKYTAMVAQDLERYQPDIVLELESLNIGDPAFDFIEFYGTNAEFREAFAPYEKTDTRVLDLGPYYGGLQVKYQDRLKTSEFTIYKREENR